MILFCIARFEENGFFISLIWGTQGVKDMQITIDYPEFQWNWLL